MKKCPSCGSGSLYRGEEVSAGGGYAPNFLPGLGGFWTSARLTVLVCSECGLMQFFANEAARDKLTSSDKWSKV